MPNIKSAMKRMRSDAKKAERNSAVLSELKTLKKKLWATTEAAKAATQAQSLVSRYDKAVSQGVIPRGRADRNKSRVAAYINKLKSAKK